MAKEYCIDTSGLSNPLQSMPPDIHETLWSSVKFIASSGRIAITEEIFNEMILMPEGIGDHIQSKKSELVLEIGDDSWDWNSYVERTIKIQDDFRNFISEYNGNRKSTIGLNDVTIVALADSLGVPLVSMESSAVNSIKNKRIPDLCNDLKVQHMTFNDFLRSEGIKI